MCGIAGLVNFDGELVAPELLRRMVDMIGHRGPDANGVYTNDPVGTGGSVGLAHARLSIIDLSGGQQPMPNGDRSRGLRLMGRSSTTSNYGKI